MKKCLKRLALSLSCAVLITAFAGQAFAAADAGKAVTAATQQDLKNSKKSQMVEITIPTAMVEAFGYTEEVLKEDEYYSSVVKNDDGSFTISVAKDQHQELMDEMKAQIDAMLEEQLIEDSDFGIESIQPNDDYTSFTVNIGNRTQTTLMQSYSVVALYTYGGIYDLFNGGDLSNIHVDFVNFSGDVVESADSGELGPFFESIAQMNGGGSGSEDTEEDADVKDIKVLKEYTLSNGSRYTRHYYVIRNSGKTTLDLFTSTIAYDAKGNMAGVGKASYDALPPGQTAILCESIETDEEIASYEPSFRVEKSSYEPVLQDISVKRSDVSRGVILQITNDGEIDADFVQATALFFKDGELVDSVYRYFINDDSTLLPGETVTEQLKSYETYDSVEVYLSGGKHYNW